MKNFFKVSATLLLLFAMSGFLHAQGNLQFNQVINVNLVGTVPSASPYSIKMINSQVITVPAGKVLKIESVECGRARSNLNTTSSWGSGLPTVASANSAPVFVYLDETILHLPYLNWGSASTPQTYGATRPIWLSAGTYTFYLYAQDDASAPAESYSARITAIEFNVVP